jgi:hypothetical protein
MVEVTAQMCHDMFHEQRLDMFKPQNDENPSSLLAKGIFHRDLHVIERYIGGTCRGGIACFDLSRLHTRPPLNEDNRKTVLYLPLETSSIFNHNFTSVLQPTVK